MESSSIPELQGDDSPVKLAGTVKEFDVESSDPEDWTYPKEYRVPRATLRSFSPMFFMPGAHYSKRSKMPDLSEEEIQDPEAGMYTSSGGSMRSIHKHFEKMDARGVMACNPLAIVASIAGTLSFNLSCRTWYPWIFYRPRFSLCLLRTCPGYGLSMRFALADRKGCL